MTEPVLCLGYLKEPRGLKGYIKVNSQGELLSLQKKNDNLKLYSADRLDYGILVNYKHIHQIVIEQISEYSKGYLVKFKNISTREEAEKYSRLFIGMSLNEAKEKYGNIQSAEFKEHYLFEYLYLEVIEQTTHELLGQVIRIEEINQRAMFIVQKNNVEDDQNENKELMLPAFSPYIKKIDLKKQVIYTENLAELE